MFAFLLLLGSLISSVSAQSYGNEWIDTTKVHVKFNIGKDGVYRIGYFAVDQFFTDAGVFISQVPLDQVRLFCMGKQVPIFVKDNNNDNVWDFYDYIEFVGHKLDGSFDKELYNKPEYQRHTFTSYVYDSASYFLTYRTTGTQLKYKEYQNSSPPATPPKSFHIAEFVYAPVAGYANGERTLVGDKDIYLPSYSKGEGFCGETFGASSDENAINYSVKMSTLHYDTTGPAPELEAGIIGASNYNYQINHHVKFRVSPDGSAIREIYDTTFSSTNPVTIKKTLTKKDIGNPQTYLLYNSTFINGIKTSNVSHSHTILRYPKNYILDDSIQYAYTEDSSTSPVNIEWSGYGDGFFSLPVVYDEVNLYRINATYVLGQKKIKYTIPATAKRGKIFIQDEAKFKSLISDDGRIARMLPYAQHLKARDAYIMITAHVLNNSIKRDLEIEAYKNFWSTRYDVLLNEIEDLYNSFSYGIPHPLAIRHYCKYLLENTPANYRPKYMLLVGRGFDMSYNRGPARSILQPFINRNFIPAIGTPVSDNLFTAGLIGTLFEPAIPTGRISVDKPEEITDYLNKVKDYVQSINNYDEWQKHVLHLSGGASPGQAIVIQNRLKYLERNIISDPFAGTVKSFSKSAGSQVDENFIASISNELNNGVSLVTFLGHGSSSVTDIDIGDPAKYLNKGKYPIFYFNGCQVGNPCIPNDVTKFIPLSEKLIKYKDRGAVAFLGQTTTSELYTVATQMQQFYNVYFDSTREKSVGDVLKMAIKNFQSSSSILNRIHCEELLLQGDPALPVYAPVLPDFSVSDGSIFLDPPNASALMDSFRVGVIITNKGRGVNDSFTVDLGRLYPDGTTRRSFNQRWKMHALQDTVYFVIKSKDRTTGGRNVFTVNLNNAKNPVEFRYENNVWRQDFEMPTNGVNLISPKRFAIIGKDTVDFIAQANDLFKQNEDFYFELDTVPSFKNPLKSLKTPITARVMAKWTVQLPVLKDTQVYFWRARLSSAKLEGGDWVMHSFTYIKNHGDGWMQNVAWQYSNKVSNNEFASLTADTLTQKLRFNRVLKKIYIDCAYGQSSNLGVKEAGFGSQDLNYGVCSGAGIVCMPWDGKKLVRKPVDPAKIKPTCEWGLKWTTFGHFEDYQLYYAFDMGNPADQDKFVQFVDAMDDSMYVTIYSRVNAHVDAWKPSVFAALNKIGSAIFDTVSYRTDDAMWVALGKKGWKKGVAQEAVTFGRQFAYVQLEGNMFGDAQSGQMISEKIGTTNSFNEMYFTQTRDTGAKGDNVEYQVFGIPQSGEPELIKSNILTSPLMLSDINSEKYKFIQLKLLSEDKINNSSANLNNWRVVHDPVPEGSLYPDSKFGYVFHDDTLYEGDTFYIKLPFKNIGKVAFRDSISFDYSCYNKVTRQTLKSGRIMFPNLAPDSMFYFEFKLPTTGLSQAYALQVNANQFYEQPEITLVNNSALINFFVTKDIMSPRLDVTFDGRHILQGDIVSANPVILILSKDENKFLLQKDSSTVDLFIKKPGSSSFEKIPWGNDAQFFAAAGKENKARVEYRPKDLASGVYTLKVQSRDASKNLAGTMEYQVEFNVVREQAVTHFYPYPNPFTSSMRFVFTLTGTEIPDEIRIKIMTAEGRVVKEVTKEELGDVHIGNNITSWTWDGTDQYGDKLGNGTYFYKVTVKNNGQELKLRQSAGDASFKDQVGVIYLMR